MGATAGQVIAIATRSFGLVVRAGFPRPSERSGRPSRDLEKRSRFERSAGAGRLDAQFRDAPVAA